ncbi:16S rRNA (uracil(1498)-N(3))-methyltransferase [Paenibacillus sp. MMS18-CY102]|uniref:16S rRNA (uracil(1498)-N(3))-methyltransferase n=1 Tax=Paenibacillus sp. MMS18-CY102 TaxID=2682849 RepID=UPI00136657FD|nr:16S rRNA (uracil(1498)-N(3))-methyltransferase [Paenibacillus sp. MMS18-CY102]MWC27513.1 16S rRNA (uracil(1498)-N(3))-methyltransferase [Paenibacillus sp. MMS18-CY102]
MQRYFVPASQFDETTVTLLGDDAHHAARVMRMRSGDSFIVSDGAGREAIAKATSIATDCIEADIVEKLAGDREPAWQITIAQSLPKGDKMELIIQKGTEIGAYSFVPFESERMIVQYDAKKEAKRLERWQKIAKEAAEQAHRSRIPAIAKPASWKQLVGSIGEYDLVLFCYEEEGRSGSGPGLRDAVRPIAARPDAHVLVIVGPEGGFTDSEAADARSAGAVVVGLGKRILRTETAGLVALAALLYESGEMGGN